MSNTRVAAAAIVLDRDLGQCMFCGRTGTDGHHRDVVGAGGSSDPDRDRPERIGLLCRLHHGDVHHEPERASLIGWYLFRDQVRLGWENVPVWSPFQQCWFLLSRANTRLAYPNWLAPDWDLSWITEVPQAELGYKRKPTR